MSISNFALLSKGRRSRPTIQENVDYIWEQTLDFAIGLA